jgi:lipopolysaccharide export system permease protein
VAGKIVFRHINREILRNFFAILAILTLIFLSQRLVNYLRDAASGDLSGLAVLQLLMLFLPVLFSLMLPLTLFLAILLGLGRSYVEHEMTVMRACGVGEQDVMKQLMRPTLVLAALTAIMTLFLMPWAAEQQQQVLDTQVAEAELSLLTPGRFQESGDKQSVLYVEKFGEEEALSGVFFATVPKPENAKFTVLASERGSHWQGEDEAERYLVLNEGFRYEFTPGSSEWNIVKYERYFMRAAPPGIEAAARKAKAKSSLQLLQQPQPAYIAEFHWRLAVPLSMPILALIAIPLCRVQPREGRFAKILPGLGIYLLYTMLLITAKSAMEDDKLPLWLGMWPVHLLALAVGIVLIRRREIRRAPVAKAAAGV